MLEEYFESRGFMVTVSADSGRALELATGEHQSVILIDRVVLGDGIDEFCRDLRTNAVSSRSVVVVLTLSEEPEEVCAFIDAGADDYVVLPMRPEQLFSRLYLAERRSNLRNRDTREEESAQHGEHELQTIADASPVMLWVAGPDGHGTFFNRRYLEHTGRDIEHESGMGWAECLHPEDYSRCLDTYLGALKRCEEFRVEYRLRRADGSYCWVLSNGVPRHTQFGEFLGYIGSCVDISEQKHSEGVLRSSEERLRLVMRNMPVLRVGFDERHRIIVWNRECERVTGYGAEEVIGNPKIMNLLAPQHCERDALLERWSKPIGTYRDWEMEIFCQSGEVRTVAWSNISEELRVPGWSTWAIGVDITDRKNAEIEHCRLQAQIQEAQKFESLGMLAGGVAHDFNNLLVGVLGCANLALRDIDDQHPQHDLILQIQDSAKMAAELTNQMLAYSGKGKFIVEPIDLSRVLRSMAHLLEIAVPKSVDLEFDLQESIAAIEGDVTQIRQIAMNLVTNAAEAIGDQPGRISVRSRSIVADRQYLAAALPANDHPEGAYVELVVADTGCGMDEEVVSKVFDPFFTTKFTGRGLGLAAVIGIVRGHGGAIRAESAPGEGTIFSVLFPTTALPLPAPAPVVNRLDEYRGDGTLLVVDDEESVRVVAKRMLQEFGFEVLTADSGFSAVEQYEAHGGKLDGVLLDLTMPQMSGEETLRRLQSIRADVPVILTSGYSEHEVVGRLGREGLAGFIQKPYTADDLIEKIRDVLSECGQKNGAAADPKAL